MVIPGTGSAFRTLRANGADVNACHLLTWTRASVHIRTGAFLAILRSGQLIIFFCLLSQKWWSPRAITISKTTPSFFVTPEMRHSKLGKGLWLAPSKSLKALHLAEPNQKKIFVLWVRPGNPLVSLRQHCRSNLWRKARSFYHRYYAGTNTCLENVMILFF